LDGGGVFSEKKSFTRMQIKPKSRKSEMAYITGVKNIINPKFNVLKTGANGSTN